MNQSRISKVTDKESKKLAVTEEGPYEGRAALTETTHALTYPDYRYQPRRKPSSGLVGRSNGVVQTVQDQSYYDFGVESATPSASESTFAPYCSPVSSPLLFVPKRYATTDSCLIHNKYPYSTENLAPDYSENPLLSFRTRPLEIRARDPSKSWHSDEPNVNFLSAPRYLCTWWATLPLCHHCCSAQVVSPNWNITLLGIFLSTWLLHRYSSTL